MRTLALRALPAILAAASIVGWSATSAAQSAPSTSTTEPQTTAPAATSSTQDIVIPVRETKPGPNAPMLITGTVLFGGTYAASAIGAWQSLRDDDQKLYYPIVGPWMDLGQRDCTGHPCDNETLNKGLLVADGIAQGAGAVLMVASLFTPAGKRFLVFSAKNDKSTFTVTPARMGTLGYGMSAVGTF